MIFQKRRAVAPIIATLLMVAIAVVGGMMVFVFAQGFFEDTQIVAPTIEQIFIFGYNATDAPGKIGTHAGTELGISANGSNSKLADGEAFTVFVRNLGGNEVLLADVQIYGETFDPELTTGVITGVTKKTFRLSHDGTNGCGCQTLNPGQEGSIVVGWDKTVNGEIKVGRPIFIKIETGSGATFTQQIINGQDLG